MILIWFSNFSFRLDLSSLGVAAVRPATACEIILPEASGLFNQK
jgi:hypothetical protein